MCQGSPVRSFGDVGPVVRVVAAAAPPDARPQTLHIDRSDIPLGGCPQVPLFSKRTTVPTLVVVPGIFLPGVSLDERIISVRTKVYVKLTHKVLIPMGSVSPDYILQTPFPGLIPNPCSLDGPTFRVGTWMGVRGTGTRLTQRRTRSPPL